MGLPPRTFTLDGGRVSKEAFFLVRPLLSITIIRFNLTDTVCLWTSLRQACRTKKKVRPARGCDSFDPFPLVLSTTADAAWLTPHV